MKSYAFIFARGGSKGLPGKNIKLLNGKPLIQYSIEIASNISSIDNVFVSTDCSDIAKIARLNGAEVIDRPKDFSQDDSPEWQAWRHAISWVRKRYGNFEEFISLPPTSPLRALEDVTSAINKRSSTGADICIAITSANRNPYFNMVKKSKKHLVELVNKTSKSISRRQDAPEVFDVTTVVYVANVDFIMKNDNIFAGTVTSIHVPKQRAIDIDDIHDFNFSESILKNSHDENYE